MASDKFMQKIEERRRLRAAQEAQAEQASANLSDFAEFIPENPYERTEEQVHLDNVIDKIDIWTAYKKWVMSNPKKSIDMTEWGRDEVHVSCPKPDHPDVRPSAWINTAKGTWFCGGCQEGGDKFDLAAYGMNFPVPGYKDGQKFHELREAMAQGMGYTFHKPPGATEAFLVPPAPVPTGPAAPTIPGNDPVTVAPALPAPPMLSPASPAAPAETSDEKAVTVLSDTGEERDDLDDPTVVWPALNWRQIVPYNTFLGKYMELTTQDDVAEEYHFWNGLLAIGFALGRDVTLYDRISVFGNLDICTIGNTGSGKSQAKYHLDQLLIAAMPHDWSDPASKGVKRIASPGSAEVLINSFMKPVPDPTNPKITAYFAPVRGIVDFNELSSLVGRAARIGNTLKPTLMEFYDMVNVVSTSSMGTGVKEAHQPFCSVLTTTQPKSIRQLVTQSDADSGFLNRWVFAAGPEKTRIAIGGIKIDMSEAVDPLQAIVGWAGLGFEIQWSQEAAARFTDFYHAVIQPTKKLDDSGMLTRTDLLMKKLCLLLSANKHEAIIQLDTVESAILMWDYIIECYAIPSGQIGNSLGNEVREEILRHAERLTVNSGKGVSLNDLNKRLKRKKYPLDLVVKTLKYMVELGELEVETNRGPGRPTTRYKHVG